MSRVFLIYGLNEALNRVIASCISSLINGVLLVYGFPSRVTNAVPQLVGHSSF
jgi:hypothetical protein